MKTFGSLKCFRPTWSHLFMRYKYFDSYGSLACKNTLSISGWCFIRLSSALIFPDPGPPTSSILYGYGYGYGFNYIYQIYHYIQLFIFKCFIDCSLHNTPETTLYGYEMTPLGNCILLLSLAMSAISLTLSVNVLCESLLNLLWNFNIVLFFSKQSL